MMGESKLPPVSSTSSWNDGTGGRDWAHGVGAWIVDLSSDTGI